MIKRSTIPTILGIFVLLAGMFAGVYFLKNAQVFKIGAAAGAAPKDIRVSNISDNSAVVSWTTDEAVSCFLTWGKSQGDTSKVENEGTSSQKYFSHSIALTGLAANTNYYYKINCDGSDFDNGGIPWQLTTGAALDINTASTLLSGSVINASGIPEKKALIYADINNYLLSTLTSDSGNYVFQLGSTRTPDLTDYAQIDPSSTLVQISVSAPPDGVASAQIFPQSGNPVPTIVIGQVYDFRSSPANNQGGNPSVNLNLPQAATQESKFNVATSSAAQPTSVILESITEGETITTTKPQFFGKGPGGENITITVHSEDPITQTIQIPPNSESWSYTVPTDLAPGNHTITISWVDAGGITRFLTRDFVVQAGEVPAFTASESGTITTPTETPTALPEENLSASPTAIPEATFTPEPTLTPSPVASATAMPIPVTGDLTPTLILFIMGLAVITFSFVVWKIAEN
jgi:hypothetical protein